MTDTNYKFIIYLPPENQLGRLLNRWVKEIDAETDDKFTIDDSLIAIILNKVVTCLCSKHS